MKLRSDKILDLLGQLEELHLHKHTRFQVIKEHPNTNKVVFQCYSGGVFDKVV